MKKVKVFFEYGEGNLEIRINEWLETLSNDSRNSAVFDYQMTSDGHCNMRYSCLVSYNDYK